jgi:hypothetical protein
VIDGLFRPESGVDPLSLAIGYRGVLVGAAAYDPVSGLAIFAIPPAAPKVKRGPLPAILVASDYQEAKNTASVSDEVLPNTTVDDLALRVVDRPTLTWLRPEARECVARREQLLVVGGSSVRVRSVRFFVDGKQVGIDRRGGAGLYATTWRSGNAKRGRHTLRAVVLDVKGRTASAERVARVCR